MACTGGAAGWELPWRWRGQGSVDRRAAWQTHKTWRAWSFHSLGGAQTTGDWRAALRATRTWRVGSGHTRTTAKAAWFGGGAEVRERQSVNLETKKVVDSLPKLELTCS